MAKPRGMLQTTRALLETLREAYRNGMESTYREPFGVSALVLSNSYLLSAARGAERRGWAKERRVGLWYITPEGIAALEAAPKEEDTE